MFMLGVEVECPHCHAKGIVMLPPPGAVIIGPCPECGESVMIFMASCLPLNKAIIVNGTTEEKEKHILDSMMAFLQERIHDNIRMIEDGPESPSEETDNLEATSPPSPQGLITDDDIEAFRTKDLKVLGKGDAFFTIFPKRNPPPAPQK